MTTAFYVEADPTCDNPAHIETLHIGSSAGGWKFQWHSYENIKSPGDLALMSRFAWEDYLATKTITDEAGHRMSMVTFLERIEPRRDLLGDPQCGVTESRGFHDSHGHDFFPGDWS